MKQIKISNIERHMHMFNDGNDEFNSIKWVEPIFITMTSAYDESVDFDLSSDNVYLNNMLTLNYRENTSYSPVETITTRNGLEKISSQLTNVMLHNFSHLAPEDIRDLRDYLQYLFLELMNNVADHAQATGHVMAQYYPSNKKVQFAISDNGVGFLKNINLKFADIHTEEEAIFKAIKKGVTATPQKMYGHEKNAGFGLYAMIEILKQTKGRFIIISNDTLIRYRDGQYSSKYLEDAWKGVVVAFEFDEAEINFSMDDFKREYLWKEIMDDEDEDFF